MAHPEKHRLQTIEEAVAELKRAPAHPVRLMLDGIEVELRRPPETAISAGVIDQSNLGDRLAAIGPWEGESTEDIDRDPAGLTRGRRSAVGLSLRSGKAAADRGAPSAMTVFMIYAMFTHT